MSSKDLYRSKLFQIEGDQRTHGTASDFTFDLGTSNIILNAKKVVLKAVIFPNVFYNITSNNNQLVVKYLSEGNETVSVEPGFYTATQLAAALLAAIDAAVNPTFTGTIVADPIKGKLTFTVTNVGGSLTLLGEDPLSTMSRNLGLSLTTPLLINNVIGPEDAPFIASLAGLTSVNIHSKALAPTNYIEEDGSQQPVLMNIPITTPWLGINVYEATDEELNTIVYPGSKSIQAVDIRLTDRQGNTVDLSMHNVKILCKVYYE